MTGSLFDQWRNSTIGTPVSGFTGGNVKGATYDEPGFSVACCCSIKTIYIIYIYIYFKESRTVVNRQKMLQEQFVEE